MLCHLCLSKPATMHLTEKLPSGKFGEAHYCSECYEAKYLKPPPGADSFPRPRFTLKKIMILIAVWTVPNAVTAWVMKSNRITGTPEQLREWTMTAFLAVNLVFAFYAGWLGLLTWLQRVTWYNQTGGALPMPVERRPPLKQQLKACVLFMPFFAWIIAAIFLEHWLTPRIWPGRRGSIALLILLMWAPILAILTPLAVRGLRKNPATRERIRLGWSLMSPVERVLRIVAILWMLGFLLLMIQMGPSLVRWGFTIYFPIPPAFLIVIVGQIALMAGIAVAVRRR
jgi:hypothetical protein